MMSGEKARAINRAWEKWPNVDVETVAELVSAGWDACAAQSAQQPDREAVMNVIGELPLPAWWGGEEFGKAADAILAALPIPATAEPRHFAPYGSTNAVCDETVPRGTPWDAERGEYGDSRFTTRRALTTCPDCLRLIRIETPIPATGEADAKWRKAAEVVLAEVKINGTSALEFIDKVVTP